MILECPSCHNRYLVDPRAVGKTGRMVRCAKCKYEWFADAPRKEPEADVLSAADTAETPVKPRPIPPGSSVPAIHAPKAASPLWLKMTAIAAMLAFLATALVYFRPLVIEAMPALAKAYAALGMYDSKGIVFANMEYAQTSDVSKDRHHIAGYLVNTGKETHRLPVISISLYDDKGILLRRNRIMEEGELPAGGQRQFSHELTASPESTRRIVVETGSPFELKLR